MFRGNTARGALIGVGIAAVVLGFAYYVSAHPMDFRVYHFGARGVFDGTRPVYGTTSGFGWPMHYRYPPLFLLLFAPFAALPLGLGAATWLILKFAVLLCLLLAMIITFRREGSVPRISLRSFVLPFLFITPYIVEDFRYGNAQFFVVALTAAALLASRKRSWVAGGLLALAISIKVWPLFFVPYLAVRRDWKVVGYALAFAAVLTVVPSLYFGVSGNLNLLGQWFAQEYGTQLGKSEIWFPNQSLRGVLMRYLTAIDYSQVPDTNYRQVNVLAIDPGLVRLLWLGLSGTVYALFLAFSASRRHRNGWLDHGLAFCFLILLEPFSQKYALVALLWPALAAGLAKFDQSRMFMYGAIALVLLQPLAPGAAAQRLLQVLGLDFGASLLLTIAVATACLKFSEDSLRIHKAETDFGEATRTI